MKRLLLIGFLCLLFSSAFFALEEIKERQIKYTEVLSKSKAEKINTVSFPFNSSVVIPEHLIGSGDQNNSDHQKKFKDLFHTIFSYSQKGSNHSFYFTEIKGSLPFQAQRYILYRNLRL